MVPSRAARTTEAARERIPGEGGLWAAGGEVLLVMINPWPAAAAALSFLARDDRFPPPEGSGGEDPTAPPGGNRRRSKKQRRRNHEQERGTCPRSCSSQKGWSGAVAAWLHHPGPLSEPAPSNGCRRPAAVSRCSPGSSKTHR